MHLNSRAIDFMQHSPPPVLGKDGVVQSVGALSQCLKHPAGTEQANNKPDQGLAVAKERVEGNEMTGFQEERGKVNQ